MSKGTSASRIDFEHWLVLARDDPDSFEQLRSRMLDDCIARASAPHQERLRRLQWRIDRIRERASNPLAACVQISDLMWNTFNRLGEAYRSLEIPGPTGPTNHRLARPPRKSARILPFRPRRPRP
jgi:hypothetical protein